MLGKSPFGRSDVVSAMPAIDNVESECQLGQKKKTFVSELARGGEWGRMGGMTAVAATATFHQCPRPMVHCVRRQGGPLCICHVLCFCWDRAVLPQLLELCVKRLAVCPHPKRFKAEQYLCYLCPRKGKGRVVIGEFRDVHHRLEISGTGRW